MTPDNYIDLNTPLKSISGQEMKEDGEALLVSHTLANILASNKSADPLRAFLLAKDLYQTHTLSQKDVDFVKKTISQIQNAPIIIGQILDIIK